jgi:hypothetical protein
VIVTEKCEMETRSLNLLRSERSMRLLPFLCEKGTQDRTMKESHMYAGAIDPELFEEVRSPCRGEVGTAPERQAGGYRHRRKPRAVEQTDVRAPADPPIQTLLA